MDNAHTLSEKPTLERRPNVEYQVIYDLCAQLAQQSDGQAGLIVSSPLHSHELTKRIPSNYLIDLSPWAIPQTFACAIWAQPSIQQSAAFAHIQKSLAPDGKLAVLVSGRLANRLTEQREGLTLPANETPLGWNAVRALLANGGFCITQEYTFRGATTLGWDILSQFAARFGRDDLADRLGYQMRANFAVAKWQQPFSTLGLIIAQRSGNS